MIKLYGYWRSTAAYRVRIALALKKLTYESIAVDLAKGGGEQHQVEYRELNPQKLVPTLIDDGFKLSQSMAIIEYLDEKYPQAALITGNISQKAQIREMAQIVACDIHPLNNLRVLQYLKNKLNQQQSVVDNWYSNWVSLGFLAIEASLAKNQGCYCFGDQITLADVFLIPQVYNAHRFGVPMQSYPRINEVNRACLQLEAFRQAMPEHQTDANCGK